MALKKPTSLFGEKQPQFPESTEQFLFLLEFYVQEIRGNRLKKLNRMFFVPTSVNFQFLNFKNDELEVTPVNPTFDPQAGISDTVEYFNSGRSIIFSVVQHAVTEKMLEMKIKTIVKKKIPENINPDIIVGQAEIDMTKHFAALRKEMLQCWFIGVPSSQVFENDVPLFFKGNVVGTLKVFIRLSSYGQSIVTEFEALVGLESSYVFRGNNINERSWSYKCRVINSKEIDICKDPEDDSLRESSYQISKPPNRPYTPCGLSVETVAESSRMKKESSFHKCLEMPGSQIKCEILGRKFEKCEYLNNNSDPANQTGPIRLSRGITHPCGNAVVLKVSGLLDVGSKSRQPKVTLAPEYESGSQFSDPNYDVFILRIGKKGLVGLNEKSDLQLEMRTPKGLEKESLIKHETREAQTEEEAETARKSKGGKGKKRKK